MRSMAVMNQKGGVGKTTSAVNLAAALAIDGRRVLLVDMDPQAHASIHFGVEPEPGTTTVYDLLTGDDKSEEVRRQVAPNLWLIPASLDLAAAEMELSGIPGRELILREKIADDPLDFDVLLIDCPPSLGVLTLNALVAVDEILIPLQPHFLALHGLSKLLDTTIRLVAARLNPRLRVAGVVLCLYDGATTLAKEVAADVETFFAHQREEKAEGRPENVTPWSDARVFKTRVRRNIRLAEAPSFGKSIFDYDPKSNGADDYRKLTAEIFEKGEPETVERETLPVKEDVRPGTPSELADVTSTVSVAPCAGNPTCNLRGPADLAMETD